MREFLKTAAKVSVTASAMLALFLAFASPAIAQTVSVPDPTEVRGENWTVVPEACLGPNAATECGFEELVALIANVLGALMVIALSVAVVMFAYAGFLYLTAAGDTQKVAQGRKIFTGVAIGLIFVFGAYLFVQVFANILNVDTNYNQFLESI